MKYQIGRVSVLVLEVVVAVLDRKEKGIKMDWN
jgi:hypothetical protein